MENAESAYVSDLFPEAVLSPGPNHGTRDGPYLDATAQTRFALFHPWDSASGGQEMHIDVSSKKPCLYISSHPFAIICRLVIKARVVDTCENYLLSIYSFQCSTNSHTSASLDITARMPTNTQSKLGTQYANQTTLSAS